MNVVKSFTFRPIDIGNAFVQTDIISIEKIKISPRSKITKDVALLRMNVYAKNNGNIINCVLSTHIVQIDLDCLNGIDIGKVFEYVYHYTGHSDMVVVNDIPDVRYMPVHFTIGSIVSLLDSNYTRKFVIRDSNSRWLMKNEIVYEGIRSDKEDVSINFSIMTDDRIDNEYINSKVLKIDIDFEDHDGPVTIGTINVKMSYIDNMNWCVSVVNTEEDDDIDALIQLYPDLNIRGEIEKLSSMIHEMFKNINNMGEI